MKLSRLSFVVLAAVVLAGCSEPESVSTPSVPAPAPAVADISASTAPTLSAPTSAPVPPPDAINQPVNSVKKDYTAPIVPGSPEDPNVVPASFVPKAPALQYVVNGQPNLQALSEALQIYCMWKKAVPGEMQELVTSKFLPELPALPAGKKYGINAANLTVAIVN